MDKNSRSHNTVIDLEPDRFVGQLQNIIVIHLKKESSPDFEFGLGTDSGSEDDGVGEEKLEETLILAHIHQCKTKLEKLHDKQAVSFYKSMGPHLTLDITTVQCLVGRVPVPEDRTYDWAIVDRSGDTELSFYVEGQ